MKRIAIVGVVMSVLASSVSAGGVKWSIVQTHNGFVKECHSSMAQCQGRVGNNTALTCVAMQQ